MYNGDEGGVEVIDMWEVIQDGDHHLITYNSISFVNDGLVYYSLHNTILYVIFLHTTINIADNIQSWCLIIHILL